MLSQLYVSNKNKEIKGMILQMAGEYLFLEAGGKQVNGGHGSQWPSNKLKTESYCNWCFRRHDLYKNNCASLRNIHF